MAIATSCGGSTERAADGGTRPAAYACTGPVPPNATPCPSADANLTADTPRVVATSCRCTPICAPLPCSYVCNAGYVLGQDGACAVDPAVSPVVTDNGDGTVRVSDRLGETTWLRDASCLDAIAGVNLADGPPTWTQALAWTGGLADGSCALHDRSLPGDWRLPSQVELMQLSMDPIWGGSFVGIRNIPYWSSLSTCIDVYGAVSLITGDSSDYPASSRFGVLPVRAGPRR